MSLDIGGSKSKSKTSSTFTTLPKAPAWVEDPTRQLTQAIMALGQKPSSSYVTGSSPLQNSAFSMGNMIAGRYGAAPVTGTVPQTNGGMRSGDPDTAGSAPMGKAQVNGGSGQVQSGQGLFASLGTPGLPDYGAYLQQNPDVANAIRTQGHFSKGPAKTAADYDGNGTVSDVEAARYHYQTFGEGEGRVMPGSQAASTGGVKPAVSEPRPGYGAGGVGTASTQNNPLANYANAGLMAQIAGNAGPNLSSGAQVGAVDPVTGARVGNVRDVTGSSVASESLLKNLEKYMSPYTEDVVNTTLAGFDTNASRLRAQQAAAGAGRGAFGGSRYAVGEAVMEGELARERAASEAGLRDRAFTTGASLSGQDADRRQQAGMANAQLSQQAALANQQSELSRILAQAGFDQQAGLSNQQADLSRVLAQAGFDQQTGQFNAGQRDQSLDRQMQAAGLLTQIGATQQGQERSDMEMLAGLGGVQRGIEQDYAQADLQQLSAITQLLQQLGLGQFIGQTGTEAGRTSGTQLGIQAGFGG